MARIELHNLHKTFGPVVAVKNLNVTIEDGEFVVFVGPSGCGKTTTLRMIAGFEDPTGGEIRIDGRVVNDLEPRDRGLGMVFQSHALFPHKNVAQNIEFGLRMKDVPKPERVRRVREVAEMVRIGHLLDKMPGQCSGGESQRVALARTLVTNPSTFLLDEPLSSLDAKLRRELRAECDRIHQELRRTFIYVTHDQEEAMTMADLIAVMNRGKIEQLGSPTELYERPRTAFVAGFLGVSNLLYGRRQARGEVLLDSGDAVRVAPELLDGSGDRVALGVRPEKIRLGAGEGDDNALVGTVIETAYIGLATQVLVDTGAGRVTVFAQNDRPGTAPPAVDSPITLSWSPEATFVIDPEED